MSNSKSGIQLARLWIMLLEVQGIIDNEVIPLAMHLELDDPELMQALETLSEQVRRHFERWRLMAAPHKMPAKDVGA